jgi:hypothetical protein
MEAVGLDQWLAEQRQRFRRSFIYADVRYPIDPTPIQQ